MARQPSTSRVSPARSSPDLRAIYMSGETLGSSLGAFGVPASELLRKPFVADDLLKTIAAHQKIQGGDPADGGRHARPAGMYAAPPPEVVSANRCSVTDQRLRRAEATLQIHSQGLKLPIQDQESRGVSVGGAGEYFQAAINNRAGFRLAPDAQAKVQEIGYGFVHAQSPRRPGFGAQCPAPYYKVIKPGYRGPNAGDTFPTDHPTRRANAAQGRGESNGRTCDPLSLWPNQFRSSPRVSTWRLPKGGNMASRPAWESPLKLSLVQCPFPGERQGQRHALQHDQPGDRKPHPHEGRPHMQRPRRPALGGGRVGMSHPSASLDNS